jgi:hypothetical protein
MEEKEAKEQAEAKVTRRVIRRFFLFTKLWVSGRETRGSKRESAIASGRESDGGRERRAN